MRNIIATYLFFLLSFSVFAQNTQKQITGKVKYISSQFTYVSFENTDGIEVGDTLFVKIKNKLVPKLIVSSLSSRSCAAKTISRKIKKGTSIIALVNTRILTKKIIEKDLNTEIVPKDKEVKPKRKSTYNKASRRSRDFYGRFSLSGYSNISNNSEQINYQNWRYSLSLNADRINGSKFYLSSYITFRYRADEWSYIKSNIGDALKIYDLALTYKYSQKLKITFGRKINSKITNIGAIDGLQVETKVNKFTLGGVIGSRPNFSDYGINFNLLEVGGFINRVDSIGNSYMQNTVSLFQQMNDFTTDRRFFYLQHSNNFIKNFNLFLSSEIDLFKKEGDKNLADFSLTSLYMSARYSPARWISTSLSYDARKNVIYYETFKNYADRLIESALRQGFRFRVNLRPINYVFLSLYSGYRFRDSDIQPSKNFGASVTHSRIPYLNLSANISFVYLNTSYIDGNIAGIRLSKDFFNGILNSTFSFRRIDYTFTNSAPDLLQNIFMIDLSTRLSRRISFSISFEGTYEKNTSYSNIYANFTTRF